MRTDQREIMQTAEQELDHLNGAYNVFLNNRYRYVGRWGAGI